MKSASFVIFTMVYVSSFRLYLIACLVVIERNAAFQPLGTHLRLKGIRSTPASPISKLHITEPHQTRLRNDVRLGGSSFQKSTTRSVSPLKIKAYLACVFSALRRFRRKMRSAALVIAFLWCLMVPVPAFAGPAGGRMGGSFGQSQSRSEIHRPIPPARPPSGGLYKSHSSLYSRERGHLTQKRPLTTRAYYSRSESPIQTNFSPRDIVILTGTGVLIVYGFQNNVKNRDNNPSPLGSGATTTSIILSLSVPDKDDPNTILQTLRKISSCADTTTRRGLQNLVTEGTSWKVFC
jgi:hypothetical protein